MVALRARMSLSFARRAQAIRSLRTVLGETRAMPGCVNCHLYADLDDDNTLVLLEEWADVHSLRAHVRSDSFRVVLSALDSASDPPEVRVDTIAHALGMGFIAACRQGIQSG